MRVSHPLRTWANKMSLHRSDGNYYLAHIGAQLEQEEKEGDDPTYEVEFEEKNEGGVVYRSQMRLDKPAL